MNFLEKHLEDILYETDNDVLDGRGLCISGKKYRQVKIGNYGIADLISVERDYLQSPYSTSVISDINLDITIYELKRDVVDINAFLQALRYAKGISRFMEFRKLYDYVLNIVLIGSKLDKDNDFVYITDLFDHGICHNYGYGIVENKGKLASVNYYRYNYNVDGISFHQEFGYKLTNEGF